MADVEIMCLIAKVNNLIADDVKCRVPDTTKKMFLEFISCLMVVREGLTKAMIAMDTKESKAYVNWVKNVITKIDDVVDDYQLCMAGRRSCFHHPLWKPIPNPFWAIDQFVGRRSLASQLPQLLSDINNIKGELECDLGCTFPIPAGSWREIEHPAAVDRKLLVGLEAPTYELISWLTGKNHDKLQAVAVVGKAGMGKTELALQVYHLVKFRFNCFAWITVTQFFHLDSLLENMITQVRESIGDDMTKLENHPFYNRVEQLELVLRRLLKGRRFMLVLDDVCSVYFVEYIKYALLRNLHGALVITTSHSIVENRCSAFGFFLYHHKLLSFPHSWALFCHEARINIDALSPELETAAKEMVKMCSGHPLAVTALAGLISNKVKRLEMWNQTSRFNKSDILRLAYNELPPHLKPCFLYFGLFPENHSIDKNRLIQLWLAEGFVQENNEDAAEQCLNELIGKKLVDVSEIDVDGRVRKCLMHTSFHHIILEIGINTNFGAKYYGYDLEDEEKCPRLSMLEGNTIHPPYSLPSKRLRSLMIFGINSWLEPWMPSIFVRCKLLKILDLTNAPIETFPGEIPDLPYLTYLSLSRTKLKKLPSSIGKLTNLMTLNIKGTHIVEVPWLPKNLLYLLAGPDLFPRPGVRIDFDVADLGEILRLSVIDVSSRTDTVKQIQKLVHLKRLAVTNLTYNMGKEFCSSLKQLKQLESLSISTRDKQVIDLEDSSMEQPLLSLKRLYFHGPLIDIPRWIYKCENLTKFKLNSVKMEDGYIALLQALPNLKMLEIEVKAADMTKLSFSEGGFKELICLHLYNFQRLKEVNIEEGALPCLQELYLRNCQELGKLPLGLKHLIEFKELHLIDVPHMFVLNPPIEESGYNQDYLIIHTAGQHKITFYFTYRLDKASVLL